MPQYAPPLRDMQFIIERSDYKQAIIALNHSLCVTPGVPVPRA